MFRFFYCLIYLLICANAIAQPHRMSAGFSIKEKKASGEVSLIVGNIYYDKGIKKLVYDITFPVAEVWVFQDSFMYKITKDSLQRQPASPMMIEMSVFNLALNGNLDTYGLDTTAMKVIATTVEADGTVVSTCQPRNRRFRAMMSRIELAKRDKLLTGIALYGADEALLMKQVFRKYDMSGILPFPQDILQITYLPEKKEEYKVTTFRNIQYDDPQNEAKYNYPTTR